MKKEVARREIESLDYYLQNHTNDYGEESHTAMMMAVLALSENKGEWIPIEVRPLTDEEKEYYTEHEYPVDFMMMYDCPMPDDGQEVLITTSTGYVTTDTYYIDEGGYFENYCDEGDVKAWMPKPEPYKKGGAE